MYAISAGDSNRGTAILHHIHNQNWTQVVSSLKKRSARRRVRQPAHDGITVLHCACWLGGAPGDVIKMLVKTYPDALRRVDDAWGFTPLHMATYSERATSEVVRALVESYPDAAAVRDGQKLTPLHRVCLVAGENVHELVHILLSEADPSQVAEGIRDADRDRAFHLIMARAHYELQRTRCEALRSDGMAYHEEHVMLERIVEAALLLYKVEMQMEERQQKDEAGSAADGEANASDAQGKKKKKFWKKQGKLGRSTKRKKKKDDDAEAEPKERKEPLTFPDRIERAEIFQAALQKAECPNVRLFLYLMLWVYPELAAASPKESGSEVEEGYDADADAEETALASVEPSAVPAAPERERETDEHHYKDKLTLDDHCAGSYDDTLEPATAHKIACGSKDSSNEGNAPVPVTAFTSETKESCTAPASSPAPPPPAPPSLLHAALLRAKSSVGDAHWCVGCRRGLVDPHFISQDTGESCDVTCAHRCMTKAELKELRKAAVDEVDHNDDGDGETGDGNGNGEGDENGGENGVGNDNGNEGENNEEEAGDVLQQQEDDDDDDDDDEEETTWYRTCKNRLYKDITITMPYGNIIARLATLYPQSSAIPFPLSSGRLPLHAAVAGGHTWYGGVQAIARSHPPALAIQDPLMGLYPFMGAAMKKPNPPDDDDWERKRYFSELTTCYELLKSLPALVTAHL